jgi:hypothetical protein
MTDQSLSRHFYSIDEVQAALYYTSMRGIHVETLFWAQEMILSGLYTEAISTLFESWIWQRGPFHLDWLVQAATTIASDEIVESEILLAAYQLNSLSKRDHSLWSILALSTKYTDKPPDRITKKTPRVLPSVNISSKELYFVRAMYQGKAECAWWMARYLNEETLWGLLKWYNVNIIKEEYKEKYGIVLATLQSYESLLGYRSPEYDIVVRCLAVLSLSLHPMQQEYSFKEASKEIHRRHQDDLDKWQTLIGTKAYRIFTIPTAALYGTTCRGRSQWSQQNYECLNNVEKYMKGCPFWDEVLKTDAEAFYQEFFPDDIPDEWTKVDKQKSHGDGLLAPNEKPNLLKYVRNYLSRLSRMCWVQPAKIHKIVEELETECCHPTAILAKMSDVNGKTVDKKWLQPVIKKLIV